MVNLAKLRYDAMPCLKLIIQCRNNINTVFLVLYITHAIPYCAVMNMLKSLVICVSKRCNSLSPYNVIPWRSLLCIPRGIFRSTYIFNGYSSVLTLPRYFGVLENLQFNDKPQHLDILYALWLVRIELPYKVFHRDTRMFRVTLTLTQFLFH